MLAWRYDRPIIPLILHPLLFPDDVAYWLEGAQWIEVFDRPADGWLWDTQVERVQLRTRRRTMVDSQRSLCSMGESFQVEWARTIRGAGSRRESSIKRVRLGMYRVKWPRFELPGPPTT